MTPRFSFQNVVHDEAGIRLYQLFFLAVLALSLLLALSKGPVALLENEGLPALPAWPKQEVISGQLPLSFIPNMGQSAHEVQFQTHAMQGSLFFTKKQVLFALPEGQVTLAFEGVSPAVEVDGGQRLQGIANYYSGSDPAQWATQLPTYGTLVYRGLYPGIDLHYEGVDGQLKGTYLVAPGADPGQIRWRYRGATSVALDSASGDLQMMLSSDGEPGKRLIERAPIAWQEQGDERVPVDVAYHIDPDGSLGFVVGRYNPSLPLILDPYIVYSSFLGGTLADEAYAVTVDSAGHAYITGSTRSTDFLGQTGTSGTEDVWIIKLDPSGSTLLYATFLVGAEDERPNDIVAGAGGTVYLSGYTTSTDFPTHNATQPELAGGHDFFATKLNETGQLAYSTFLGTQYSEMPEGMAVDGQGQAHITGTIFQRAVVFKLDPNGSQLYGALFGGEAYGETLGTGIAVNGAGQVYLTGQTTQKDFGGTAGAFQTECDGVVNEFRGCRGDVFLAKLSAANNLDDLDILFSSYYGGKGADKAQDLVLGPDGYIYITGQTISVDFPTTSAYADSCPSGTDPSEPEQCLTYEAFVARFHPDFAGVVYSTYFGGNYVDEARAVAVDGSGSAYITGWTMGNDLPLVDPIQDHAGGICYSWPSYPRFCSEAFLARFTATGTLGHSTYLGGNNDEFAYDIAVEGDGKAYLVGSTLSSSFPTTPGSIQAEGPNPGRHGFVTKIAGGSQPTDCYALTLAKEGDGTEPQATPDSSSGCAPGSYTAGAVVQLTATPAAGWRVSGWIGTSSDTSTATTNTVTMPAAAHTVTVRYVENDLSGFDFKAYLPIVVRASR